MRLAKEEAHLEQLTITVKGAAQTLGISATTVRSLIRSGELSSVRVAGRRLIHAQSVRRLAEAGSPSALAREDRIAGPSDQVA